MDSAALIKFIKFITKSCLRESALVRVPNEDSDQGKFGIGILPKFGNYFSNIL
jgi:hypothetical protein